MSTPNEFGAPLDAGAAPDASLVARIANELFTGQAVALPNVAAPAATLEPSPPAEPAEIPQSRHPLPGDVPAIGGGFLSGIPLAFETPLPAVSEHAAVPGGAGVIPSTPGEAQPFGLPTGEADLLGIAGGFIAESGLPSPLQAAAPFYFLPAPSPPQADPQSSAGFDVAAVRRDFPALQQTVHGKPLVWLDNAATTQKPQAVIDALAHFYAHDNSNIHRGAHSLAERATIAFEEARRKVQWLLGAAEPEEIVWTRGTTEAINLVAQSYGRQHVGPGDEIIVMQLEHHSNIVPWQHLAQERGATLKVAPIDDQGQVLLDEYAKLLSSRTKLVAFAHVSNVLGTVLPIGPMVELAHAHGVPVLVDGAQGAPHLPVNVQALDLDFYVFSGHKLFGPTGIGVLYGKRALLEAMPPWQAGGNMIDTVSFEQTTYSPLPAKFEAGTAHIAGAVGLGAAIDYVSRLGLANLAAYEEGLMAYGTSALATVPNLRQIGTTPGKVGALAFVIPGAQPQEVGKFLDREGIAVRAGHHCAQPALARYGLTAAVRPSLAFYNTPADLDALVAALHKLRPA